EVREIEETHGLTDRSMLGEGSPILDGHVPAGERAHLRAERPMLGVQRRAFEPGRGPLAHGVISPGGSMANRLGRRAREAALEKRTEGMQEARDDVIVRRAGTGG